MINLFHISYIYLDLSHCYLKLRVTNFSKTLIDNIFFDSSNSKTFSANLAWNISDHYHQFLLIKNIYPDKKIKHNIHQRKRNKFDQTGFVLDFLDINWNSTLETSVFLEKNFQKIRFFFQWKTPICQKNKSFNTENEVFW